MSELGVANKNINYIAVDMIEAMLGLSKRNIEKAYNFQNPENLFLIRQNVELIQKVFSKEDNINRIYINF
ncbi:MAG: tRNA (guanosine(46)-N7)-methyltransferase TrmB, partial [Clostridia bacterium]|nr:tRNA (guanosine(46)-N7)-methyltransferase TrmB [Clostridia bacterium]